MPVAGTIKLDIIADSQDRASATLRAVQGELRKTEDRIRSVSAAGKEDGDISDILARGSDKSRSALRAEVNAREAAAGTRRSAVQAAREAATASGTEGGALAALKGKIEGANKAKELFNKTLGLAGFIGIAAGAVGALGALIDKATGYRAAINDAKEQQQGFNDKLDRWQKGNRDFGISKLAEDWRGVAKAQDDVVSLTAEALGNQTLRQVAIGGELQATQKIVEAKERLRRIEASFGAGTFQSLLILQDIERLEQTRNQLRIQIERSEAQEPGLIDQIKDAQERSNVSLTGAKMLAGDLSKSLASAEKFAGGVGVALNESFGKFSWDPLKSLGIGLNSDEAGKKVEKDEKERRAKEEAAAKRGASAGESARKKAEREAKELADKEAGIRREVALLEFEAKGADEHQKRMSALAYDSYLLEKDLASKRIALSTYALLRRKLDLEGQVEVAAEVVRMGEAETKAEEKRQDGIEKAAKAAKTAKEKSDKDAADALEKRAKGIERIGEYAKQADGPLTALSARLGGLAEAVDQTAGIWAQYERGQETLGDAVSGTLGFIGAAVAQSISDKRVAAGVEGAFEAAASIASFASGNIPAGIGHAAAAAAFFGVAAGGGAANAATGAASGRSSPGSSNVIQGNFGQSSRSSRPEDTRTVIVHHYGQGIIYGQGSDVARAGRNADRSLAGTGMQNTGY